MSRITPRTLFLSLLFIILLRRADAQFVTKPSDTVSVVGQRTYFNCSSHIHSLRWYFYAAGTTLPRAIINGSDYVHGKYSIENFSAPGTSNLIILSVGAEDAGQYECRGRASNIDTISSTAELTVLDTLPVCDSNINANDVIDSNECSTSAKELQLFCSVTYHGNGPPAMGWIEEGSDNYIVDGINFTISGNLAVYNLTLKTSLVKSGASYKCQAKHTTTPFFCTSGPFTVKGNSKTSGSSSLNTVLVCALVILLPLSIAGGVIGGILLEKHRHLKLFKRRRDRESDNEDPEDIGMFSENQNMLQSREAEIEQLKRTAARVESLETEKRELEERFYSSDYTNYAEKLIPAYTIQTQAPSKINSAILGITILEKELFVVSENIPEVEVYSLVSLTLKRTLNPQTLSRPLDISSCTKNACLYFCDGRVEERDILRLYPDGNLKKFWTVGKYAGSLSVTREGTVVVCFPEENQIKEYTAEGVLLNNVKLIGVQHICHAIKTTNIHFLFSHGSETDVTQRVCAANVNGVILKSYGKKKGSDIEKQHMNCPVHLAEDSRGNILVADSRNSRVLLLKSTLEFGREILSAKTSQIRFPVKVSIDKQSDRLFVADNDCKRKVFCDGRILVFDTGRNS